jgi:hypothetical protein
MTAPKSPASDDYLPLARLVRWVLLAGMILFSAGLYFRFGLKVEPFGSAPAATTTTTP